MRYPQKLTSGDGVAIIAPSLSLTSISPPRLARAEALLRSWGLSVLYARAVRSSDRFGTSPPQTRLEDLHWAFGNPDVRAVLCANGGYSANGLLDGFDWALIRANPKVFCGYSDITVLGSAITRHTGLVTYYGPNLMSLGARRTAGATGPALHHALFEGGWTAMPASDYWSDDDRTLTRNRGPIVLRKGLTEGTVIGGNLGSLFLLQGTEHWLAPDGQLVLCVEEDDLPARHTPHEFDRRLRSLLAQPGMTSVRALLIGRFQPGSRMTMPALRQIVAGIPACQAMTVVANLDFGHTDPKIALPVGGQARVRAEGRRAVVELRY